MKKSRRRSAPVDPVDTGPPERAQHHRTVLERDINNRARVRIVDQLEIDRLLLDRLITMDQHSAGEHLYRVITEAGYFAPCRWVLDDNIRGGESGISHVRSSALLKLGLARVWLNGKAGNATTRFLWAVLLGERRVPTRALPPVRHALDAYQSFESWWHGRDHDQSVPDLLADMPRRIQAHRPRSFHHEV